MKNLLLTAVLLGQLAVVEVSAASELESLAAKVNAAAKGIEPQRIFALEEAWGVVQAVMADIKDNRASQVVQLLRSQDYDSPAWQITAKTVIYNPYGGAASTREGRKTLESIFTATIKPGEHWLHYSAPRGWTSPFRLRWYLASWMTKNVIQTSDMVDKDLLREDPAAWLVKHGVNQKGGDSAKISGREGAKSHVEAAPAVPVQDSAPVVPLQSVPQPQAKVVANLRAGPSSDAVLRQTDEGLPGYAFWLAGSMLGLVVLAWFALKKRRAA